MSHKHTQVLIIGSGSAGCTAAIYAARAGLQTAIVHGMQPGGQLTITTEVENYPGFADVIQGPWLMEQMTKQAENCGTEMITDLIVKAELTVTPFRLTGDSGTVYTCDCLIIATGATAKWLGIPGEKPFQNRGVSACATCDGAFFKNRNVAVIGGGNTALEEALYLAGLCKEVTLIHRRDSFRGEKIMQDRVFNTKNIKVLWNHVAEEITGESGPMGGVTGLNLKHTQTGSTSTLAVDGVFIAIGHKPNTELFKGVLKMDEQGYLIVPPGKVSTDIHGVFAAGDVCDPIYRQAVTAAGLGCMAALDAKRWLEERHARQNAA